jgi:hypothetical protein
LLMRSSSKSPHKLMILNFQDVEIQDGKEIAMERMCVRIQVSGIDDGKRCPRSWLIYSQDEPTNE